VAPDPRAIAAPLLTAAVAVPPRSLKPCSVCHSGVDERFDRCFRCNQAARELGPLPAVLPITLSVDRQQMHHALLHYKDDRDERVRNAMTGQLAALFVLFYNSHA
jgi:hypothetical protein